MKFFLEKEISQMCSRENVKQNEGDLMIFDDERLSNSNRNIKEILESKRYAVVLVL